MSPSTSAESESKKEHPPSTPGASQGNHEKDFMDDTSEYDLLTSSMELFESQNNSKPENKIDG